MMGRGRSSSVVVVAAEGRGCIVGTVGKAAAVCAMGALVAEEAETAAEVRQRGSRRTGAAQAGDPAFESGIAWEADIPPVCRGSRSLAAARTGRRPGCKVDRTFARTKGADWTLPPTDVGRSFGDCTLDTTARRP